jgi:hypothetical protein
MQAAEILFEAYDLLPEHEERDFLRKLLERANHCTLASCIGEILSWDQMEEIVSLLLFCGEVDEVKALVEIYEKRAERKDKVREAKERAAIIRRTLVETYEKRAERKAKVREAEERAARIRRNARK